MNSLCCHTGLLLILNWIAIQGRCNFFSHSFGNEHDAVVLCCFCSEYNNSLFRPTRPMGICLLGVVVNHSATLRILDNLVSSKRSHLGYAEPRQNPTGAEGWFT
jgi:hypothetical protein